MGSTDVGALRVSLGLDTAEFSKGLEEAQAKLGQAAAGLAKTVGAMAVGVTAAYAKVALGVNDTLKSMDEIGKSAQKFGIPVEQLSALKLAADLSDVSMESLGKGVGKLSKGLVEAAGNGMSGAANAFRAIGVSATDSAGKVRPTIDVIKDISTKFENMSDGPKKTAMAMQLFGKAGADLIPLLNMGGAGLADMMLKAKALGITFSTEDTQGAEKFRDTLTILGAAKDGIIVKLTQYLLPALQTLADRMLAGAMNADKQKKQFEFLKTAFEGVARGVLFAADNFKTFLQIGAVFVAGQVASTAISMAGAFLGLAKAIQASGLMFAAFEAVRKIGTKGMVVTLGLVAVFAGQFQTVKDMLSEVSSQVSKLFPDGGMNLSGALKMLGFDTSALTSELGKMLPAAKGGKKGLDDYSAAALAGKNALDQFLDSQKKSLASQQAEFDATNEDAGAKARLKLVLEGLAVAQANHINLTDAQKTKLTEAGNEAALMALKLSNLALIGQTDPFVTLGVAIDATNAKLAAGGLNAQDYATLSGQAAQLTAKLWADSATSLGGSFESIGSSMASMNKDWARFAKAGQAIGAAIAFVNSYIAATEAFAKTPFPANVAIAAGVLAKGMAMVAAIKSTSIPGYAAGGFVSGLGTGTSDSINARLSDGEFVMNAAATSRYRPQLEAMNSGGGGGGTHVFEFRTNGRRIFTFDEMVQVVEGLNEVLGHGYKLKVT